MIHLSQALQILDSGHTADVTFVKKSTGEIVHMKECVQTSSSTLQRTRNLKSKISGEYRKVYNLLIIKVNGTEVYY